MDEDCVEASKGIMEGRGGTAGGRARELRSSEVWQREGRLERKKGGVWWNEGHL